MVGQHWLMRSREPSLHSAITTRLPPACSACTWVVDRLEHVLVRLAALGGKILPGLRADIDGIRVPSGTANGVSRASAAWSSRALHSSSVR